MMTRRQQLRLGATAGVVLVSAAVIFGLTSTPGQTRFRDTTRAPAKAPLVPRDIAPKTERGPSADLRDKGGPPVNWDRPFIDGVSIPSLSAASNQLPFEAALPATVGTPAAVVVHGDIGTHTELQALGLVFNTPSAGRFIVTEEPTKSSTAELLQLAASCDPADGCEGSWTMVTLSDGTPALEIAADISTGLIWVKNGVRYDVYGPTATFDSARATQLANAFEAVAK